MITFPNSKTILLKILIPTLLIIAPLAFLSYQKSNSIDTIIRETSKIRGITYSSKDVKLSKVSQDQIEYSLNSNTNDEVTDIDLLYRAFKYFESDDTINKISTENFNSEVLGYYSVENKTFYISSSSSQNSTLSTLERYLYAHEFTHYLQDTKFDIATIENKFGLQSEQNSDQAIAFLALIEGDATFSAMMYTTHNNVNQIEQSLSSALENGNDQKMHPYAWEINKFHYIEAPLFILKKYKHENNFNSINDLYQTLSFSTGDIISNSNSYNHNLKTELLTNELKDIEIKYALTSYTPIFENYSLGPWEIRTIFSKFLPNDDIEEILNLIESSSLALWYKDYEETNDSYLIYWKIDYKDNKPNITQNFEKYCETNQHKCEFEVTDQYLYLTIDSQN